MFSFHPVKIITTGEGGAVTTKCEATANKLKMLRSHGITKERANFEESNAACWAYEQQEIGFNYRLTDIQAALGCSQIERLENIVKERQSILKRYEEKLSESGFELLECPQDCKSAVHLAVIRMKEYAPKKHREIFEKLRNRNIGVQLHYIPVHLQPVYKKLGFKEGEYENAERYSTSAISIPVYPGLSEEEQGYVINEVKSVY